MEVKSVKEVHTELLMHSVRFAKDEQGRRSGSRDAFTARGRLDLTSADK